MGRKPSYRGFTLVELLAVLVVVGIGLALGVPSLQRLSHASQVRGEAQQLLAAIQLTRSEAVARNTPVSMCPSPMARTGEVVCGGVYADGWIIFSNRNRDTVVDEGEVVMGADPGLPEGFTMTNRAATRDAGELITYYPDGSSRRNRTLMICSARHPEVTSWSVVLNIVGRPRIASGWGNCPGG